MRIRKIVYKRSIRSVIYWLKTASLPGLKKVPVYDVLSLFVQGAANGKIWQRAKGLAYSMLMALPPLLIFMFTLIAYFPVDGLQDEMLFQLHDIVPEKVYDRISSTVNDVMGHRHSNLLSIGFAVSIILAANGIYGCYRSMNYANDKVERRPFLPVYAVSVLLVFALYLLVVAVVVLLVGYRFCIGWLISAGVMQHTKTNLILVSTGRWIILIFLALLVLSVVYYFAQGKSLKAIFKPNKEQPSFGFFAPGSLIATTLLFLLSWLMQIYLSSINRFNLLYGSIGTLLMIMLWIFMNCWVMLIGYEINCSILAGAAKYNKINKKKQDKRHPFSNTSIAPYQNKQP